MPDRPIRPRSHTFEFARRAGSHPLARQVKIADLEENMDVTRLNEVGEEDAKRLAKYLRAWQQLTGSDAEGTDFRNEN